MQRSTASLVWIDCEMTGLDPDHDRIIEIACFVTDACSLTPVEPTGLHRVVRQPASLLAGMDAWCVRTHAASGLTDRVLHGRGPEVVDEQRASADLVEYIRRWVPDPGRAVIAGNSVHADVRFLRRGAWPPLLQLLHYRIFDVSSLKEAVAQWAPDEVLRRVPRKQLRHTAREDILESIAEARFYREAVFAPKT